MSALNFPDDRRYHAEHLWAKEAGDGSFEQKFFIQIVEREEDALIKIAPYSSPFLTDSVRGALEGMAHLIETHYLSIASSCAASLEQPAGKAFSQ